MTPQACELPWHQTPAVPSVRAAQHVWVMDNGFVNIHQLHSPPPPARLASTCRPHVHSRRPDHQHLVPPPFAQLPALMALSTTRHSAESLPPCAAASTTGLKYTPGIQLGSPMAGAHAHRQLQRASAQPATPAHVEARAEPPLGCPAAACTQASVQTPPLPAASPWPHLTT